MIQVKVFRPWFPENEMLILTRGVETMNLTLEECIEFCGLTHQEIDYFMQHEHISDFRAAELGEHYVVVDDSGTPHLRRSILEDIHKLKDENRPRDAKALEAFIRDFVLSHPHLNRVRPGNPSN